MQPSQDQIFAAFEADRWFARNKEVLEACDPEKDPPLKLISLYQLKPQKVLEVGAVNGFRLAAISERYGARVVALELSAEAIADGKSRFARVEFVRGVAHAIPVKEAFDLVIVNFVFRWIDRANLLRAVTEIDRLLVDGGFLIIGDFYPSKLIKVPYHHLTEEEVYTYKQNYAATFLASGLYHPVCLLTGDHASKALVPEVDEDERIGVWLLRKKLNESYIERSFHP